MKGILAGKVKRAGMRVAICDGVRCGSVLMSLGSVAYHFEFLSVRLGLFVCLLIVLRIKHF